MHKDSEQMTIELAPQGNGRVRPHHRQGHTAAIEVAAEGLPVVIEVVDTEAHIQRVRPKLDVLMDGGIIMQERAQVLRYVKGEAGCA